MLRFVQDMGIVAVLGGALIATAAFALMAFQTFSGTALAASSTGILVWGLGVLVAGALAAALVGRRMLEYPSW
jgi:hypothetical protein